ARAFHWGSGEWQAAGARLGSDSHNQVCHADDGGGIHAAAEFGEDRTVGTEAALHRCSEHGAEVFFIFSFGTISVALVGIEVPISSNSVFRAVLAAPQQDIT